MDLPASRARQAAGSAAHRSADFEPFFKENYRSVVRLAYGVLGDFARAQDVAQEVFLAAYRRFPDSLDESVGWLRVAAVHTALNVLRGEERRERRHRRVSTVDWLPSAEEAVVERESREQLRAALRRLPRRSAAILVLRHGGMSYAEIAVALGVKTGHVGTMLRRAESALCKELDSVARE